MMTGDQALPQPLESDLPPRPDAAPTELPDEVLKREALLRSFRWVFLVQMLVGVASLVFAMVQSLSTGVIAPPGLDEDAKKWLMLTQAMTLGFSLLITVVNGLALYWALTRPRKYTRVILTVFCILAALGLLSLVVSLAVVMFGPIFGAGLGASAAMMWGPGSLVVMLSGVVEPLILFALTWMAHTWPGNAAYTTEGIAYFEREDLPRRKEILWIPVLYTIFLLARYSVTYWWGYGNY